MNKYRNKKCSCDGFIFDSMKELKRYKELKLMEKVGHVRDLKRQVIFELAPPVVIQGRKRPALKYKADFVYRYMGQTVIEDVKGVITKEYRIKRHLMKSVLGLDITEI